jgi:cell division protein ZapA (FtsZ GTPase activity inhibitor)
MNELTEKYLARMLEGAEQGLEQIDTAVEQINTQMESMMEQRQEMMTAINELKDLLGLEDEVKEDAEEASTEKAAEEA